MKAEVEKQVVALLGPKTEEDAAAAAAPKKKVGVFGSNRLKLLLSYFTCGSRAEWVIGPRVLTRRL